MDFYCDAQIPTAVIEALNIIESSDSNEIKYRVRSTAKEFGDDIKDIALYHKLKEVNGILITHDLKMTTRAIEFTMLKELKLTAFVISLPHNRSYSIIAQAMVNRWFEVRKIFRKHKHEMPFICRLTTDGHKFL